MARKVVNRRELRAEAEAAEAAEEGAAVKKKKVVRKTKRKTKAAADKEVRLKAFWGVFNQSLKRVALYEYGQQKQAEKKAKELSEKSKSPHFVKPVKEVIEE